MTQSTFVERRKPGWDRLEHLLKAIERRGLRKLAPEDIEEFGRLYRWVTSDLAFADGRNFDPGLRAYLHRLTARAHAYVYGGTVHAGWQRVFAFVADYFPNEVRRSKWYILACAAITLASAMLAYWLVSSNPVNAYVVLPGEMLRAIHKSLHDSNFAFPHDLGPLMSTAIIENNIRVAVYAFGLGIVTVGVGTVWVILQNGIILGGYGALFSNAGFGYDYWATIAPHGVLELTAIQVAGGAGLLMAAAVFNPGRLRRIDALTRNARRAGTLALGVCLMLACAGLIEGNFSPLKNLPELRLAVGALTAVLLVWYFGFVGKQR
mgnify:CR=1 FL=1